MKVKPEIRDRIIQAAQALVAEGVEEPTNQAVLERMGKGSLSHVSPVMREWREARKAEVVAVLEMPAELKKAIESSVGQVWTSASNLAAVKIQEAQELANETVSTVTDERDEALTEISRLEDHIQELEKQLADKDATIDSLNSAIKEEQTLCSTLNTEKAALSARLEDRDERIKSLQAELKESRGDNKSLQAELVAIAKEKKPK